MRSKIRLSTLLTSSTEEEPSLDVTGENSSTVEIVPTSVHTALGMDVDFLMRQGDFRDVNEASFGSAIMGSLPIYEQSTWIIPFVIEPGKITSARFQMSGAESYVSLVRSLVKSSGIYALSSVASPLISLVLAPFLTHSLSHAEYGALAVLNTIIALAAGITQVGLSSAFFRAYSCDYESQRDRLGIVSTVIILLSLTSIFVAVGGIMMAPWLAELLFGDPALSAPLRVAAVIVLLQNFAVPGFAWLRAENRAIFFSLLSIGNLLMTLGATLVFVGLLHMGLVGSLLATSGGYAFVVICTLPVALLRAGLRFRFDIARNLLSFGVPLIFNFVSYWVLQLSDRYLLSRLGSLAETASYAVAYSLGGVMSVVIVSPFMLAWPTVMFTVAKRDDAAYAFQLVFRWLSIVLLFATFAFSLISIVALNLLFPRPYHGTAPVIPIIALSVLFYGIYNVFAVGVGVRRKTWLTAIFMTLSALVNVGFNIILIPLYGSMGAALSTLIAYAFLALISYVANQRIYPVPFEIGMFSIALVVGIALYAGSTFLAQQQEPYAVCAIYVVALALYGGCLVLLGKFPPENYKNKYHPRPEDPVA